MTLAFNPTPINWQMLAGIGENIGNKLKERKLTNAMQGWDGQDPMDLYNRLISAGQPELAIRTFNQQAEAKALQGHRENQTANAATNARDIDLEIWDAVKRGDFSNQPTPEPMRLGPDGNPSVPGISDDVARQLPSVVADRALSLEQKGYLPKAGANRADEEKRERSKAETARQIEGALTDLWGTVKGFDDASIENALGRWQGADDNSISGMPDRRTRISQDVGAIWNATPWGGKENTQEVRDTIDASASAIGTALKAMIRVPGEGQWSNLDQQQLNAIVGSLKKAEDRPELERRFKRMVERINSTWKLGLNPDDVLATISKNDPSMAKATDRFQGETIDMADEPIAGSMSPTVNENTMVGGENIGRTTSDPAGSYFQAPTKSGSAAIQNLKAAVKAGKISRKQAIETIKAHPEWGVEVDESR
jgi:hypothetical protein